ncbi:ABC transporter substrate-binding protein [Paenibacillus arenilitoris]|uniref:Carbohydrate ABC transporter substrate-binding protein n=1 Tax=Paenibacillus arenilitoris TaxID=2772299 RepID=A0A927H486_9BACL|nr:ABC transporter substrate-binding protein [Paenibacillus arenilitoris]MBD2867213.1 carbohydrate ABC transporter substrate-binding protein [Paenibacillus arenilitoris]
MKNKRVLPLLLALLLMASLIAACTNSGNDAPPAGEPSEPPAEEQKGEEPDPAEAELEGTIRISLPNGSASVWNAIGESYMAKRPKVKVVVDHKPLEGYKEWLTAQFAAGTPDVDLVVSNEVLALHENKSFVDMYPFFEKDNPYTWKKWKDSLDLDAMGINLSGVGADDHLYMLNFESVQIVWVYNKEIFAKVGVNEAPKTFNELIAAFDKIEAAGYTPLALAGNSNSMWSGQAGWLVRIYADQYMRDSINVIRSQQEDYTYLPEVDDAWTYDLNNAYNDSNSQVTKNDLRVYKAIKDKEGPYKVDGNPKWSAFMENLKKLFQYTPDGFFGVNDEQAYSLFLTGKAATMMGTPGSYWQLPKDFADETKTGATGGIKPFEYGFFNMPSMEGPEVMAPARTIHIPIGFYSFVAKDAKQTELDMDFMMYVTSPEGYKVYLTAIQNSTDAALSGAPALKDIELPAEMAGAFANFDPIGNTEGFPSAANSLARGVWDYQPSVQDWVGLVQRYFGDQITTEQYLKEYQAVVDKYLEPSLKEKKLELSDLDNPERRPPERS